MAYFGLFLFQIQGSYIIIFLLIKRVLAFLRGETGNLLQTFGMIDVIDELANKQQKKERHRCGTATIEVVVLKLKWIK